MILSGTTTELPCESGYYSANTGLAAKEQCQKCPGGKFCAGMLCDVGHVSHVIMNFVDIIATIS